MRHAIFGLVLCVGGVAGQVAGASEREALEQLCNNFHNNAGFCECYAGVFWKYGGEGNMSHMVEAWEREMDPGILAQERGFKDQYDESLKIVNEACF